MDRIENRYQLDSSSEDEDPLQLANYQSDFGAGSPQSATKWSLRQALSTLQEAINGDFPVKKECFYSLFVCESPMTLIRFYISTEPESEHQLKPFSSTLATELGPMPN